jgi:hypothetical protein
MTLEQQQAIALANARLRLQESQPTEPQVTESQFAETGGGAAVGRPMRGVRLNVQPEPRPLESFMAGATRSAIDPLLAVAQGVTGGRGGVSDAVKRLAQESAQYEEANPASYIGGRVGGAILPAAGVAKGVGMIPSFARANPYVQGAGVGAITGAMTPVETGATGPQMYEQMGQNVATGGAIGTAIPVIGRGIQAAGSGIRRALGVSTGAGEEAIAQALRAGREGNQTFLENMQSKVPITNVLDDARVALSKMQQTLGNEYRSGMIDISKDKNILSFNNIDKAIKDAANVVTFKGQVKNQAGFDKLDEVKTAINNWKKLDPKEFRTPEALDNLKQQIGGILEETPIEQKTARKVVGDIYSSIKNEIAKQAPTYEKVMKDYREGSDLIEEIQKTLSINKKATDATALNKLQSLMRNNANTNYGYRMELAKALQQQGGQDLMPALAGQALSSFTPRGLAGQGAGIGAGLTAFADPSALAVLPLTSPRLVGMGAYGVGRATRNIPKLSDAELRNMARMLTTQGVQGAINE